MFIEEERKKAVPLTRRVQERSDNDNRTLLRRRPHNWERAEAHHLQDVSLRRECAMLVEERRKVRTI